MKFKVGDKVRTKYGGGYEATIIKVDSLANYPYSVKIDTGDYAGLKCYLQEDDLELIKTDLRDLLKVGYRVKTTATEAIIKNQTELGSVKRNFNENLNLRDDSIGLIAIHRPKYNGIKPMDWELVWERKEPKYYLRSLVGTWGDIFDNVFEGKDNYLNFETDDEVLYIADSEEIGFSKTQFTQAEIDKLPNQDFVKTLVKEEVK